ncbi:MAG TPA: methionyl-tRNA formyltransferase [Micropepsaceae bacterium]|nr:methionyl-tRNA formyltransferase [Micropepsaceae bacterium]
MTALRIVFMGTPAFAVPALDALARAGHTIAAIYTQPPRPAGRGQAERKSDVHRLAEKLGVPVETPARLKDAASQARFSSWRADVAVVAAYGLILPKPVLDAPRLGCLNIHASLLPRWRGAAPIHRAILAGDAETGITIMQMDEGLDTGAILMMERLAINPEMNGGALHDALSHLGARMIVEAVAGLAAGALKPRPQPVEGITYAAKIAREETRIDWRDEAEMIARKVRAFAPQPGAWFELKGERIKLLAATPVAGTPSSPGAMLEAANGRLVVSCGSGALMLTRLQRAGRNAMGADEFLRGFDLHLADVAQ